MSRATNDGIPEDQTSLLSVKSVQPSPDTVTKLTRRLRALTLRLLPVEVDPAALQEPTSRIITLDVINAYIAAAGDFVEALPYCLLRARREFMWEANHNPADYGENYGRATACEVLARRILHQAPSDRLKSIMSTRFRIMEADGDVSEMTSALELAIDSHCTIFLSSSEAQEVVNAVWTGRWVQQNNEDHDIDYVEYEKKRSHSLWGHLEPMRISVPRYQNIFRIIIWFFFLFVYSQAVREPLDRLDPHHSRFDEYEYILYFMALAFSIEDMHKIYKLLRFVTWRAFGFWNFVSFVTDTLLCIAFVLRISGLLAAGDEASANLRLRSFQVLSFVAPLIWYMNSILFKQKYVGMMQICVARMLQESGIFFALLSVLGLGFAQGLYALDMADGQIEHASTVVNVMVQSLLQAPDFSNNAGLTLYYLWTGVTVIVLLNVLISLFSSAYDDVVEDAEPEYLAFFAGKTVGMIRAPDEFLYPAPFNIIELIFIAPFESLLSQETYAKYNRFIMRILFLVPLTVIALYESANRSNNHWVQEWFGREDDGNDDDPAHKDPEVNADDAAQGLEISRVKFDDLVKKFPNTMQSSEASILREIQDLKDRINTLMKVLEEKSG
ncbi:hypothetical protein GLOTRDRAFT_35258 [Gloeophyllum trabeum ATCC 11539]|uniref:Calcium activated cation channel n=1 Tax=Gloeophyllum trabeum (strain ATCC 11539 / FP-39264 / Madison 617) TaxID=670483 RepID=S7S2A2_GLOTA|nr:uncharacterized protein GLOTRDRAFT_35258 [Gloeophyllum trabeum ATCC 11539]EPQ59899.1 hypothetical protein GLOTRDRAFT_35258 [Gloeophyllum trabeum ATCC 11539]